MRTPARILAVSSCFAVLATGCRHGAGTGAPPTVAATPAPPVPVVAPDSFMVSVETTRGPLLLAMYRDWAPVGVDRFYNLVLRHYYDDVAVFRVVPKFVVQFGIAADPAVTAQYEDSTLADDSVTGSNLRGTLTFARSGPSSRTTQLFINLVDNARLDHANGFGFAPIGRVVTGMDRVDQFNSEYSAAGPRQESISKIGNSYLHRAFPHLDYIIRMTIAKEWRHKAK
jgi:cyclophilin family peptidyl-prolyl cis-trans isomerase